MAPEQRCDRGGRSVLRHGTVCRRGGRDRSRIAKMNSVPAGHAHVGDVIVWRTMKSSVIRPRARQELRRRSPPKSEKRMKSGRAKPSIILPFPNSDGGKMKSAVRAGHSGDERKRRMQVSLRQSRPNDKSRNVCAGRKSSWTSHREGSDNALRMTSSGRQAPVRHVRGESLRDDAGRR